MGIFSSLFGGGASETARDIAVSEVQKRREEKKQEGRQRDVSGEQERKRREEEEAGAKKQGAATRLSRFRNINSLTGRPNRQLSPTGGTGGSFGRRLTAQ